VSTRRKAVRASFSSAQSTETRDQDTTRSVSTPASPSIKSSTFGGHSKGKRSVDGASTPGGRSADRLSFFGTTLGKGRKPPPSARYSSYVRVSLPFGMVLNFNVGT